MLNEFNRFIYELNFIYLKELDSEVVLKFLDKFYKKFLEQNENEDNSFILKVANVIIICTDSIMLKKSLIKDKWIHKTGENHILNTNRGTEIFDNFAKDIIDSQINHRDAIVIILTFLNIGVDCPYDQELFEIFKKKYTREMNIDANLQISTVNKTKKKKRDLLKIFLGLFLLLLIITEIHYFITLKGIVKQSANLLLSVRSIYVK